ncbi:hypothetical protein D3C80_1739840 [compost metagenome]
MGGRPVEACFSGDFESSLVERLKLHFVGISPEDLVELSRYSFIHFKARGQQHQIRTQTMRGGGSHATFDAKLPGDVVRCTDHSAFSSRTTYGDWAMA